MAVPFLALELAREELAEQLREAADRVVRSGWYVLGPEVERFEAAFAEYLGVRHCIGVGNGFDALHLALRGLGIGPGDEVIVPGNTYIATWLAVSHVGATPVPVDPDPTTFVIEPDRVEEAITESTAAILPVHLYGHPADMTKLVDLADRHQLRVVEDAAQAHGARWCGRRVGTFGHASAWSFYPSKNLGAMGDGGAVTTDDPDVAALVKTLRNYGSRRKYENQVQGVNSRLDEIQAALLAVKLPRLDEWNQRRLHVAAQYCSALSSCPLSLPTVASGAEHVWHVFVVRTQARERLREHLTTRGIQTLIHYPVAPYRQPAYQAKQWRPGGDLAQSDRLPTEVLSLPIGPHLTGDQVCEVIEAVQSLE